MGLIYGVHFLVTENLMLYKKIENLEQEKIKLDIQKNKIDEFQQKQRGVLKVQDILNEIQYRGTSSVKADMTKELNWEAKGMYVDTFTITNTVDASTQKRLPIFNVKILGKIPPENLFGFMKHIDDIKRFWYINSLNIKPRQDSFGLIELYTAYKNPYANANITEVDFLEVLDKMPKDIQHFEIAIDMITIINVSQ